MRRTALAATLCLIVGLLAAGLGLPGAPAAAAGDVTWRDDFDGAALGSRWQVVNPEPSALSVSGGALRLTGQPGDTYQGVNTARNVVVLDVPAGDFTATARLTAPVAKVYQGAGLIAWNGMDDYVRAGLTFVGSLSPSGVAIETDREQGAVFGAVGFTDRPASGGETLRLQRVGDTITTSYLDGDTWKVAATTPVSFATTQVGLYALAAQDGTTLPAAFESFEITHAAGADVVPASTFTLQADGQRPYLGVADGALALAADQPTASLRLRATRAPAGTAGGDGAVTLSADAGPVVVVDGVLRVGSATAEPTPLRLTDAGGGRVVVTVPGAADGRDAVVAGDDGRLVTGASSQALRLTLTEVDDDVASLAIDAAGTGAELNRDMFGIFFEDINYAADGGIYAELVRNRSFEFAPIDNASFTSMTGWSVADRGAGTTTAAVVDDDGRLDEMNRNRLALTAAAAGDGVVNTGFDGVALKAGASYDASVWVRTSTAQPLTLRFERPDGTPLGATTVPVTGDGSWHQVRGAITATATTDDARIAVLAGAASRLDLDMVSVMPRDTWVGPVNGRTVLRKDLAERVAAMKPGFVRFPGGCVTNAGTFRTYAESGYTDRQRTYQWKETIGDVEKRPTNKNFWGYNQTYGIGYLEYFELAEDLGADPLPVLSVGANGCGSTIPEMKDDATIARWVDDTLDLIEFANGGVDTEWGAVRARLGHPKPFGLRMIGLGNEENTTTFEANFPKFKDAVRAAHPEIQIISNSGPDDAGARFDTLWRFNRAQKVDLVDEHYYNDPSWFTDNAKRYDTYDRSGPKVFLGEYASRGNSFNNALVEAAYMTGLQRNGDVVRLASYAPLLANDKHVQWTPNAIWFDNDESWESADWQVQKMFGAQPGDRVVPSTFDGAVNAPQPVKGGVFLSTWNTSAAYDDVRVTNNDTGETLLDDGFAGASPDAAGWSPKAGSWAVSGGRYVQSSTTTTDARSIIAGAYEKGWTNYTLELSATKLAGSEGFLVGFGATGTDQFYWWNIGGWGNTRSVLQRADGGAASEVVALEGDSVATGTTYRLKVVVDGTRITLFQDGVRKLSYDQVDSGEQLFQVVTKDDATGDLVAKVVNTATRPVRTAVSVDGAAVEPVGTATTLTAPSLTATNTKAAPELIRPREREVSGLGASFEYEFPASSVTFLKLRTRDAVAPVVDEVAVSGDDVRGWHRDPAVVRVSASDDRGVARIEHSVDGGEWRSTPGATAEVRVSGDGLHEVSVRAVDAAGNVGEARPLTVGVDAAAPVTKAAVSTTGGERRLVLTAVDTGAGVEQTRYRLDGGAWTTYTAPVPLGDAAATVEFASTDVFGHAETAGRLEVPGADDAPAASSTAAVTTTPTARLGGTVEVRVAVTGPAPVPTGPVVLRKGATVLARATLAAGRATVRVPALRVGVGRHALTVEYAGDARHAASSDTVGVRVLAAASRTTLGISGPRGAAPTARVRVTAAVPPTGAVRIAVQRGGRTVWVRTVALAGGRAEARLPRLRGTSVVRVRYLGSASVDASTDRAVVRTPRR